MPRWCLVTADEKMILSPAQRLISGRAGSTFAEMARSHVILVSQLNAAVVLNGRRPNSNHGAGGLSIAMTANKRKTTYWRWGDEPFRLNDQVK